MDLITKTLNNVEIIIVDDNSPDGTGRAVEEAYPDDPRVKLYVRTEEKGLATAIRYGVDRCTGNLVVVMDTDYNHHPSVVPQMVEFAKYYDFVIGSRYTVGGGMENRGRHLGSALYNFFIRLVLNTRIQHLLCHGYQTVPA